MAKGNNKNTIIKDEAKIAVSSRIMISILMVVSLATMLGIGSSIVKMIVSPRLMIQKAPGSGGGGNSYVISGRVLDIIAETPLAGVLVSLTNGSNQTYSAITNYQGGYSVSLPLVADDYYFLAQADNGYYVWDADLSINSSVILDDVSLLPVRPLDFDKNWDCTDDFSIASPGASFEHEQKIDEYFSYVDDFFTNGNYLSDEALCQMWDLKKNHIGPLGEDIINDINNPVYTQERYASRMLDKTICGYKKESAFFWGVEDLHQGNTCQVFFHTSWWLVLTRQMSGGDFMHTLEIAKELLINNPEEVGSELLADQGLEKLASILDYWTEHSDEFDIISHDRPYYFWDDYSEASSAGGGDWQNDIIYWHIFPNTEQRIGAFYGHGVTTVFELISAMSVVGNPATVAEAYKQSGIFESMYKFMILRSTHDSYIPASRDNVIQTFRDILDELYPYVYDDIWVQETIRWVEENKDPGNDFWTYFASNKDLDLSIEDMTAIANIFDQSCQSNPDFYNLCSPITPKYCDNGQIIDNCQECGCPDNNICQPDGSCGTEGILNKVYK